MLRNGGGIRELFMSELVSHVITEELLTDEMLHDVDWKITAVVHVIN